MVVMAWQCSVVGIDGAVRTHGRVEEMAAVGGACSGSVDVAASVTQALAWESPMTTLSQAYTVGHVHAALPPVVAANFLGAAVMADAVALVASLTPYVVEKEHDGAAPYHINAWYAATDDMVLYSLLRHLKPELVVEVGSGFSTVRPGCATDC